MRALKEFKDRLIAAREDTKLTQIELARKLDMAPTQLARYESGRAVPRRKVMERLAQALSVNTTWLANGTEAPDDAEVLIEPDGEGGSIVTFRSDAETGRLWREIAEKRGLSPEELLHTLIMDYAREVSEDEDEFERLRNRVERLEERLEELGGDDEGDDETPA